MLGFDINGFVFKYRYILLIILLGLILVGVGIFFVKSGIFSSTKVEVLQTSTPAGSSQDITVEISGEVEKAGVYKLPNGARVDDLLVAAGGFSANADRVWSDKYLNRAAKLTDGQKVYVPPVNYQPNTSTASKTLGDQTVSASISSDSNALININSASLQTLDSLAGIGQVYGQSIIEHRPYSDVSELLSKGVLKQSVYNKIKDKVTIY